MYPPARHVEAILSAAKQATLPAHSIIEVTELRPESLER
jgi:hypothetical protein